MSRQRAILDRAMRSPETVFTFRSHQISHDITLVTARADLIDLLKRKLLVEVKQGKERSFLAAPNLAKRLNTDS